MQTASLPGNTMLPFSTSTGLGALSGSAADVVTLNLSKNNSKASMPLPKLPKDRPFTNLASSSELPPNYAVIFESDANPRDKALRLKAALRRDNIQLIAYFLMLPSYTTLAVFQLCGGKLFLRSVRMVETMTENRMKVLPNTERRNWFSVLIVGKLGVI
jgi:hypothetical protein